MWTEAHLAMIRACQLEGLSLVEIAWRLGPGVSSRDLDLALWHLLLRGDEAALRYLNTFCPAEGGGVVVTLPRAGR